MKPPISPPSRLPRGGFCTLLLWCGCVCAGLPEGGRCIAPAKPGGGFDLTCQFTRDVLQATGQTRTPLAIGFQPGGIGALAFKNAVHQNPAEPHTVLAFSSGSLLNMAQGRFGPYQVGQVRWLAAVGMDHGVVVVRKDSPHHTLPQLLAALRAQPNSVVFGAGGSIGSQDWMKAALLAKAAGVGHKAMRFVAFEGGGEALSALTGNHVQVLTGDAAEVGRQLDQGAAVRVLATLSEQRLTGRWAQTPTAREQGFDIRWPILRGLYMGPGVPNAAYLQWVNALGAAMEHPTATQGLRAVGMERHWVTGPALERLVQQQIDTYRVLASELGVIRP
jgi:putative tricarboxylic transport membrane protein